MNPLNLQNLMCEGFSLPIDMRNNLSKIVYDLIACLHAAELEKIEIENITIGVKLKSDKQLWMTITNDKLA